MHRGGAFTANLALFEAVGELRRHEDIVESQVRIPRRKGVSLFERMNSSIAIYISGIEHYLDRFPSNVTTAQPYQRTKTEWQQPHVEQFARGQGIEVTQQYM